jgi:hypothetical protein
MKQQSIEELKRKKNAEKAKRKEKRAEKTVHKK